MNGKVTFSELFESKSEQGKLEMIRVLRSVDTLNGFTKSDIKIMFDWLFDNSVEEARE